MSNDNTTLRASPQVASKVIGGASAVALMIALAVGTIRPWEGRELRAYRDIVGVWTICDGITGPEARPGRVATPAQCDTMLARDVATHANGLAACLTRPVPPEVMAAFVSFTFNVGVRGACRSTAVAKLNRGDFRGGCNALMSWVYAGGRQVRGLVNRRQAEISLCLRGVRP